MDGSRTLTALVGLALGLAVSVAAWLLFDTLAVFLFLPFLPFLFGGGRPERGDTAAGADGADARSADRDAVPVRECPACDFRSRDPEYDYCPRDGRRLVPATGADRGEGRR